jgi:hypothetical protein
MRVHFGTVHRKIHDRPQNDLVVGPEVEPLLVEGAPLLRTVEDQTVVRAPESRRCYKGIHLLGGPVVAGKAHDRRSRFSWGDWPEEVPR